ncbi:glycoside hydrolase family 16 protein [Thelephora terrestris]|uniref:Glycoside hydrolase family 16 protein n=1 Tax=Thelephora terrestris TaxID=56493 RepID=A0A9P6HKK7_9AGAM|nr:glycoside hydrolase family 16 protein [Thelephora terrestris]
MHSLLLILAALPLTSFALVINDFRYELEASANENGTTSNMYWLQDTYEGASFFDEWDFFSGPDPTHGNVAYQTKENSQDLAYVDGDGSAVLRVDNKSSVPPGGQRRSVRISSKASYNGGLFIGDFSEFAYGPSVWPAFWAVGPSWPQGGEVDIIEHVNNDQSNQITLHTGSEAVCKIGPGANFDGNVLGNDCRSGAGSNNGCGIKAFDGSAGSPFNAGGGGVVVTLWDETELSFWMFARDKIPQDILDGSPDPGSWGTPIASWTNQSCDIQNAFRDMQLVINITICGDWAGAAYDSGGFPGTCADAVADPSNYDNALIRVNSILVYQKC